MKLPKRLTGIVGTADCMLAAGLGLLVAGIWPLSHEWALIVPGVLLTYIAIK